MFIIGDCHGRFMDYKRIITNMNCSIQLGDMGIFYKKDLKVIIPTKHRFIRGNHDNPGLCANHPNYMGDFGYIEKLKLFFVSGAWSIDQNQRTIGLDWWPEEELDVFALDKAILEYKRAKPDIMISHDCPLSMYTEMFGYNNVIKTRTAQALQVMLDEHRPSLWFFGHHHVLSRKTVSGCDFRCLDELSTFEISGLTW